MWSHKAIKLVEEQFILISDEVRRIKEVLASGGTGADTSRREEILKLHNSVFDLLDTDRPPRLILDDAISDRPAAMMEETSHSLWVNSMALRLAGIDATTPDPPGV
jgi:predicted amidohydrolase YtcJ